MKSFFDSDKKYVVVTEPVSNGKYYLPEILKRGYSPIAVFPKTGPENWPVRQRAMAYIKSHAESIHFLRSNELDEVENLLGHFDIRAVIAGSGVGVPLADILSDHWGLPGNSLRSFQFRYDKYLMQKRLKEAGLNYLRSRIVGSVEEGINFALELKKWPLIIKWRSDIDDRKILCCRNIDEFKRKLEELFFGHFSEEIIKKAILIQEYVNGTEYVVNTASCNGEHQITDFWENHKYFYRTFGEAYDYTRLVRQMDAEQKEICEYILKAISLLGFRFGPAHSRLIYNDRGPVLLDCSSRPMNGPFPARLLKECLGHHVVDRILDSYLDPDKFQKNAQKPYHPKKSLLYKLFITSREMEVASIPLVTLSRFLPTAKQGNFISSIETFHLNKNDDFHALPGIIFLCDKSEDRVMEDYENLRAIEIGEFQMLFNEKSSHRDYPDQKLTSEEDQKYFPPAQKEDLCWQIGAAEKPFEPHENWRYAGAGQWPDTQVKRVVITGLANIPDWETLINNIGLLSNNVPVNGHLTVMIPQKSPISYRAWELLLAALGWSVESNDNRERLEFVKTRKISEHSPKQ